MAARAVSSRFRGMLFILLRPEAGSGAWFHSQFLSGMPRGGVSSATVTMRFSLLGLISAIALFATGLLNTWFLVGTLPGLVGTTYGELLLLKISLFVAMLALAAFNRLRLLPRIVGLGHPTEEVLWQLRRNGLLETSWGSPFFYCRRAWSNAARRAHAATLANSVSP
jgi:hypothetical protein